MSRWTVYKAGRYAWTAHREGDLPRELFPTWRMALDYADRMARTREYVLPRGPYEIRSKQHIYEEPIKVEPITHFPGHETVAVKYSAHGVPAGFFLAPDELRPLALALLALAEQETPNEY